ncbi:hypothetical protein K2X33_02450 [bacterium]|nr:hypothetical protein [bacterium]
MRKVLIYFALPEEGGALVRRLGWKGQRNNALGVPVTRFEGRVGQKEVTIVWSETDPTYRVPQVGAEAALFAVLPEVLQSKPDLLINAGTAGALKASGLALGEVCLVDKPVCFLDRRSNIGNFAAYLKGGYPVFAPDWKAFEGLRRVSVGTGNSLVAPCDEREVMAAQGVQLIEMEAATVAKLCAGLSIPFLALKVPSDYIDPGESFDEQFYSMLLKCGEALGEVLEKALLEAR